MKSNARLRILLWRCGANQDKFSAAFPGQTVAQIFVHDGYTYQIVTTGATWVDARSAAQTATQNGVNGYLAIL